MSGRDWVPPTREQYEAALAKARRLDAGLVIEEGDPDEAAPWEILDDWGDLTCEWVNAGRQDRLERALGELAAPDAGPEERAVVAGWRMVEVLDELLEKVEAEAARW